MQHSRLLVKPNSSAVNGRVVHVTPKSAGWSCVGFDLYRTPSGHWSIYPPHKHDRDSLPAGSALEETYFHRIEPAQGFAFRRIYTDNRWLDETIAVSDGDVTLVPRGYHPRAAAHGYERYYLNVMATPRRVRGFHNDPAHGWNLEPPTEGTAIVQRRRVSC